jgi:hypothetical protein
MRTNRLDNSTSIFNEGDMFCDRCGQIIPKSTWEKAKSRNKPDWDHCQDCKATPKQRLVVNHPILGKIECIPYTGELDELWRPINAVGDLYKPGERLCGHKDCINSNHIVSPPKPVVSDLDMILMSSEIRQPSKKYAKSSDKIKVESALAKELTPHNR